ncbi:MFS transporter [Pseudomonas sp. SWRI59]|uniref:spinster family MFS transporter n=1 Tax=unclassified Pseudomonas TaxID=196821 RepID=UPI0016464BCB|nr:MULTISPECIES: MFS transporter [unclassified Pseudomonas]MBC3503760.1 MFS transporter [Pseudomonas sp. SWRI59]MBC3508264.1 MFS transporter [Pseudomonas sp. SWRI68]
MRTTPVSPLGWRSHGLLLLLAMMYADNFVGRQIIAVMIEPIKQEFAVSDTAMGLVSGLAFAAVYVLLGLPAGRLADHMPRTRLLAASTLLWALATVVCGLAGSFAMLVIARMAVAVCESPSTSTSMSLIADLYPPHRRSFAIACYTAAPTFSTIIALCVGAWVVDEYGWRSAFFAVAVPAFVISALCAFVVRDPARGRFDLTVQAAHPLPGLWASARELWAQPPYRCLVLACGLTTFSAYGYAMWNASFLVRSHGMPLQYAGILAGLVGGTCAGLGALFSGWLTDHLAVRSLRWHIGVPVIGHLLGSSALIIYLLWPRDMLMQVGSIPVPSAMLWCALTSFFSVWWVGPSFSLLTQMVPASRRATAVALQTIVSTLCGVGIGPLATGLLSDALMPVFAEESLRYALLLVSCTIVIPLALLWRTHQHLNGHVRGASYA